MIKPEELRSELDLKELVVRESRAGNLGRGLIFALPILLCIFYSLFGDLDVRQMDLSGEYLILVFVSLSIILPLYHFYKLLNPPTLAIINRQELWIKKYGTIDWDGIASYYTVVNRHRHGSQILFILQLKETGQELTIDLSYANAGIKTLRRYITLFQGDNQILNYDEFD